MQDLDGGTSQKIAPAADEAITEDEPRLLQLPHNESGSATTQVATGLTPTS